MSGGTMIAASSVTSAVLDMRQRQFGALPALVVQFFQLFVREILDRGKFVAGLLHGENQLGQFELNSERVAILGMLNQKHHQESNDGGASIDDELPGIAIVEDWPGRDPSQHHDDREQKGGWVAGP